MDEEITLSAFPPAQGLYDPADEHDACGVGFVAAIDGEPRRQVVEWAISALKKVWHRGAVDADGKTGDGAGLMIQVPHMFFQDHLERIGYKKVRDVIGVGQVFLPGRDMGARETIRAIAETEILELGYGIYGWRQVPIDIGAIGEKAKTTRPEIEQILIDNIPGHDDAEFERNLYILRRRIEKKVREAHIPEFYICSLSCRSIVYKGLFLAEQLTDFYPDLLDERFISNFAILHQRYSTNTFPSWSLAQPFRMLAHNGEINTLRGNMNWMTVHETRMAHPDFDAHMDVLKPVIARGSSDSAALDSAFEIMCQAGRCAPMTKSLMIPEADPGDGSLSDDMSAFYKYCNTVMEPWDGPAAIAAYDGRWIMGGLDRNGLRPFRYTITDDGMIVACSETGMVRIDEEHVVEKGRIGPGEMIGVDFETGTLYKDAELKAHLAGMQPFEKWVSHGTILKDDVKNAAKTETDDVKGLSGEALRRLQHACGLTEEDMALILPPMILEGKEALGSMGDDTPLAALSGRYRGMHHFFRQNFSQVTNPPIDSLCERRVMSLLTRLGNLGNILSEDKSQCQMLALPSPVLTNGEFNAVKKYLKKEVAEIDITFPALNKPGILQEALDRIREEAAAHVKEGRGHIVLTDESLSKERAIVPAILAVAAVHTYLIREGLRSFSTINVRTAEAMDPHHYAVLIGVGATTVNAWLVQETIHDNIRNGRFKGLKLAEAMAQYKKAVNDGLLKIMSKMGIAIISSYRGGGNFEAVGLSRSLAAEYLPNIPSRISGLGLRGLQEKILTQHRQAYDPVVRALPVGGFYRYRNHGERHEWEGKLIHMLQGAVYSNSYKAYKNYTDKLHHAEPFTMRHLLAFNSADPYISVDDVESVTKIRRRFVTPGMSLGALSPQAHGALNIAMNRIGAKSDSGEGGEIPERFKPNAKGDNENSAIKQIASGRFGVTAEYLNQCREIEIKMAQGAKPGEGGQLPGFKVTEMIGRLRHATPGVTLISPPPHHDIYSIEDLAQLIYDLKQINPKAKVCVKLVSRAGIGTIAAGVAKANADVILISGHNGGTGASPQTSIKFAGLPWELGLSEVHQVLTINNLRHRVTLRTDGGLKSGRDIVMAAILGAEEYGIGTASLVAMGCLMVRQCHSNTCPVGICTQDEKLQEFFTGTPEKVINLFNFIAEDVREHLAMLGHKTLDDVIGRTELLHQVRDPDNEYDDLDLNAILARANTEDETRTCTVKTRNEVPDTLDAEILKDAKPLFEHREKLDLSYQIRNTHRAVGARLSAHIVKAFGMNALSPNHVRIALHGSAGQSLGAFAVQGVTLKVYGDANDYVGKGLSGARIIVRPPLNSPLKTEDNTIIGNTVLYGATAGKLFAAGQAGERLAVRNSGAAFVVEGCGDNGCEYMTGGVAVILGPVGYNFAAGMTGGMAYVYDPQGVLPVYLNSEHVDIQPVAVKHYEDQLKALIEEYVRETESDFAANILRNWDLHKASFQHVIPSEFAQTLKISPYVRKTGKSKTA